MSPEKECECERESLQVSGECTEMGLNTPTEDNPCTCLGVSHRLSPGPEDVSEAGLEESCEVPLDS